MITIERKTVVATAIVTDNGVEIIGDLTWKEWDELVKAVEEERVTWFTVWAGWIVKDDRVYDVKQGYTVHDGMPKKITGDVVVKRRSLPGYQPVFSGLVKPDDKVWTCDGHRWIDADNTDTSRDVEKNTYGTMRPV